MLGFKQVLRRPFETANIKNLDYLTVSSFRLNELSVLTCILMRLDCANGRNYGNTIVKSVVFEQIWDDCSKTYRLVPCHSLT